MQELLRRSSYWQKFKSFIFFIPIQTHLSIASARENEFFFHHLEALLPCFKGIPWDTVNKNFLQYEKRSATNVSEIASWHACRLFTVTYHNKRFHGTSKRKLKNVVCFSHREGVNWSSGYTNFILFFSVFYFFACRVVGNLKDVAIIKQ